MLGVKFIFQLPRLVKSFFVVLGCRLTYIDQSLLYVITYTVMPYPRPGVFNRWSVDHWWSLEGFQVVPQQNGELVTKWTLMDL